MRYMTVNEAAADLGISPCRVRALIYRGRLRAEKLGPVWAIRPKALDAVRVRKPGRPFGWRKEGRRGK